MKLAASLAPAVLFVLPTSAPAAPVRIDLAGTVTLVATVPFGWPAAPLESIRQGDPWSASLVFVDQPNQLSPEQATYSLASGTWIVGAAVIDAAAFSDGFLFVQDSPGQPLSPLFDVVRPASGAGNTVEVTVDGLPVSLLWAELLNLDATLLSGSSLSEIAGLSLGDFGPFAGQGGFRMDIGGLTSRVSGNVTAFSATTVPLPSALGLLLPALAALAACRRSRRADLDT